MTSKPRDQGRTISGLLERPAGPLQDFTGPRIATKDLIESSESWHDEAPEVVARVAAWPLLPLEGTVLHVEGFDSVAEALRQLLGEKLPGLDWWVPDDWDGPLRRYGMLHRSLPAPPNTATGEAMALELYGEAENFIQPGTDPWFELRRAWLQGGNRVDDEMPNVLFPTRVVIKVATYANVSYPGFRVPLYM